MQTDIEVNKQEELKEELKNFIVNVGWTHKIHIVRSDEYIYYSKLFKWIRIILAAFTSSGLIGILFDSQSYILKVVTAIFSFATVAMNGLDKAGDFEKLCLKEKNDANNFWKLRTDAESLLSKTVFSTESMGRIDQEFEELKRLRIQYNAGLLNVPAKTVKKASKLIHKRKDNGFCCKVQRSKMISQLFSNFKLEHPLDYLFHESLKSQ
ncbi:SLATT domain-containing protein, partial [Listeria innocua]